MGRPFVVGPNVPVKRLRVKVTLPEYIVTWLSNECAKRGEQVSSYVRELIYQAYDEAGER